LGERDEAYERFLTKLEFRIAQLSADWTPAALKMSSRRRRAVTLMSMKDYIDRLVRGTNKLLAEDESKVVESTGARCAVMAVEYIERANAKGVCEIDIHQLFLASFVVAVKLTDDLNTTDSHWWSHVGGFNEKEVNAAELLLCSRLNWDLLISPSTFGTQRRKLALSCLELPDEQLELI